MTEPADNCLNYSNEISDYNNSLSFDQVSEAARGAWPGILTRLGIDESFLKNRHGPCPGCGGKDRFRFDDMEGRGTWVCSQGGDQTAGDGFQLLEHVHGWSRAESFQAVAEVLGLTDGAPPLPPRKSPPDPAREDGGRKAKQARAAELARQIIESAPKARADHPYLLRKRLPQQPNEQTPANPFPTLRQMPLEKLRELIGYPPKAKGEPLEGDLLIATVGDWDGITTLELIDGAGRKAALAGGRKSGCWWAAQPMPESLEHLLIGEGVATVLSACDAIGWPGVAALSCGNLPTVARAMRQRYPKAEIVILADIGNGQAKAGEAAKAIDGALAIPDFGENRHENQTDFNDLALSRGLETVRKQIGAAQKSASTHEPQIPFGYACKPDGVRRVPEDGDPERLTNRPIWVEALSRDNKRESWGRLVVWEDHDGHRHECAIPSRLFHASGNELAQLLADGGLPIVPGKERKLLQYLTAFTPKDRLTAATITGWLGSAFVLPDRTLNEPGGERIVYQPADPHTAAGAIVKNGDFNHWRKAIEDLGELPRYAICTALSAPTRHLVGVEAGGFHFYGTSSRGKTTLLQAAASVWGNGVDSQQAGGEESYIRRWNATGNALEAMAECFNDLPLIVDEIGEGDIKDFGRTIYRIMSGCGRGRANVGGGLRRAKSWRVLVLSAGERAAADYAAEDGRKVQGGQLVRLIDLPIDGLDLFPNGETVDRLKRAFAKHYGHAGPCFIETVPADRIRNAWRDFDPESIGRAITPQHERARKRFALAACMGELAIKVGILPWQSGQALEAAIFAYALWQGSQESMTEGERGIANLRAFILRHESRFERLDGDIPKDRAGFFRGGCYHFIPEVFKEAVGGANQLETKRALREAGLLHCSAGRLTSVIKVENKDAKVVSVRTEILETMENTGSTGSAGSGPVTMRLPAATGSKTPPVAPVAETGSATHAATGATGMMDGPVAAETPVTMRPATGATGATGHFDRFEKNPPESNGDNRDIGEI